jgi:hypothetical protein
MVKVRAFSLGLESKRTLGIGYLVLDTSDWESVNGG